MDCSRDTGISTNDGAVFCTPLDDGPTGSAVVAQVTVSGGFSAKLNTPGRSNTGDDWKAP
jgi:hypothetical protein